METKLKQDEELLAAHLAAITVASFLFLLLIVETVVMGWESWAIPFLVAATIALWFCHLSRSIPLSLRVPVYVVTMLGVFFFYGIHKKAFCLQNACAERGCVSNIFFSRECAFPGGFSQHPCCEKACNRFKPAAGLLFRV